MQEVRKQYTLVLVTHNMQQAARVSDFTAFFLADENRVGPLVEYGPTDKRTEDDISGRFGQTAV